MRTDPIALPTALRVANQLRAFSQQQATAGAVRAAFGALIGKDRKLIRVYSADAATFETLPPDRLLVLAADYEALARCPV